LKGGNVFITKDGIYKIGIYLFIYIINNYFILFLGDYGISRFIGIAMTKGVGTLYDINYFTK
jgi:hypothetical protein